MTLMRFCVLLFSAALTLGACGNSTTSASAVETGNAAPANGETLRVITPTLGATPDISNDAAKNLRNIQALHAKIDSVVQSYPDYQTAKQHLTPQQIDLVEHEDEYLKSDYLDVSEVGCSWYCGGGPDSIFATSVLAPSAQLNYVANNIHDFSLRTAWVEGKPDEGIGERITFQFPKGGPPVTTVKIYNGYMKSEKVWAENARVHHLRLYIDGKPYAMLDVQDTKALQSFDIGTHSGQNAPLLLTFEIVSVHPGAKYMDTAISELEFDGTGVHCFAAGTRIATPSGERPIESLKNGEMVWGFDPSTQRTFPTRILETARQMHHNLWLLDFGATSIEATDDHPFYSFQKGALSVVPGSQYGLQTTALSPGHPIAGRRTDGAPATHTLRSLRRVEGCKMTYTLVRLEDSRFFFANGLCVATEPLPGL
jgi:hypothetical protein